MPFHFSPINFIHYYLKREATQFFTSIAIRYLGLGMVLIFEPIYIYLYFGRSIPLTLLFIGSIHGLFALLVVFGGKLISKIGLRHAMLFSNFFIFGYYLSLFFINISIFFVPLAILLKSIGFTLFWPAFHIDFARFSKKDHRGLQVGKLNIAVLIPTIFSPIIGGAVLAVFGYSVLFTIVLIILLISAIPLFLSKDHQELYTDSYHKAWGRMFKKINFRNDLALISNSLELSINAYLWPLFMFVMAIGYGTIGGIISFSLAITAIFSFYAGKIADSAFRSRLLKTGSVLTSISWVMKYFVLTPFDAFLTHALYRISRTLAGIPFSSTFYDIAAAKKEEADEFIIYREIIHNISRMFFLFLLAGVFLVFPKINSFFLVAAVLSLGLMFLGDQTKPDKK